MLRQLSSARARAKSPTPEQLVASPCVFPDRHRLPIATWLIVSDIGPINLRRPTDCESCEAAGRAWSVEQCLPGPDCMIADVACYGGNSGASCADIDPVCGDVSCGMWCEHGYAVDDNGCQRCKIAFRCCPRA